MDVTDADAVARAFDAVAVEFGGVDVVVSNAGIAFSAPIESTTLAPWNRNMDILSTGYLLVSREAFGMPRRQGTGGAFVLVASKNGLAASRGAARPQDLVGRLARRAHGEDKEGLEEHYRQRSLLKRSVLPEDVAEAALFLASDLSAKSAGNILNVDAGDVQSLTR